MTGSVCSFAMATGPVSIGLGSLAWAWARGPRGRAYLGLCGLQVRPRLPDTSPTPRLFAVPLGLLPSHWTGLHQLGLDSGPELASPALWIWNLFLRSLALKPNSFKGL